MRKSYSESKLADKFELANRQWDQGELRSAFRLFLAAAKAGSSNSQTSLGYFYDAGIGVKPNRELALRWYRRAYRQGDACAANNIGTIFRDEQKTTHALRWFELAVNLGGGDANLEIAKIYLTKNDRANAIRYLKRTLKAKDVAEFREEARRTLGQTGVRLPATP
jgi:uncharacterized protein